MAKNQIFPACINYLNSLAETSLNLKNNNINNSYIVSELSNLSSLIETMKNNINTLETEINIAQDEKSAVIWHDKVLTAMNQLRNTVDTLETIVDELHWPMPSYTDLLFDI